LVAAGAEAIPFPDASFDLALMLKSLHHVPMASMAQSLDEVARVLRPAGRPYVSEPVYGGAFNDLIKRLNDEGIVQAAAQAAIDRALSSGRWRQVAEVDFGAPVRYTDFSEFEERMMRPTYADHRIDDAKLAAVRAAFEPHMTGDHARFTRLMHVRLLQRMP
jgi:SAM-dependent methyltransferase